MQTILFPGSFDPVHLGHINLARYVAGLSEVDAVWMVPSRKNPLKPHSVYASDSHRLKMLQLAAGTDKLISVSDIEFTLPYPSYTIVTLKELKKIHPLRNFRLLIGSDNWMNFNKWFQSDEILSQFGLMIYPRPGFDVKEEDIENLNIRLLKSAPLFPYSSTEVRKRISTGGCLSDIINSDVADYIKENSLYNYSVKKQMLK